VFDRARARAACDRARSLELCGDRVRIRPREVCASGTCPARSVNADCYPYTPGMIGIEHHYHQFTIASARRVCSLVSRCVSRSHFIAHAAFTNDPSHAQSIS
jgi:hypothetical protein